MPKTVNVRVATMDSEMEFAIQNSTTGKQLFDQVVRTIGLRETWYFGLHFIDTSGLEGWLELKKKVQSQDVKKETPMQFKLLAKYYPEDVSEELIQEITRYMFYLQVREAVLANEYFCPAETAVLLASYATQAKFGDYNPKVHKAGFLEKERVLPDSVKKEYKLTPQQWEDRIVAWYAEHKGMTRDDAILEYLKISQDLETYGINYFDISNKKGSKLLLGIDALGINIYAKEDKLTPKIGFPWSDIRHVSFTNKKFVIKPVDKTAPDFSFYVSKMKINKRILDLCMGNHELYMRRRKPDSIEVQQMKAQAKEEKTAKEAERMSLQKEKQAREDAEKQQKELEEKLKRYEEEMDKSQKELEISQKQALLLEERMREAEQEREELEEAQRRADEARREAEAAADMEKSEREIKEKEAEEAQALLEEKQREAAEREEEMRKLHEELIAARLEMEERERALEEAQKSSVVVTVTTENEVKGAPPPQNKTYVIENGDDEYEEDLMDKTSHDLMDDEDSLDTSEYDRVAELDKDEQKTKQLKELSDDLAASKVETEVNKNEVIYRKNQSEGRDKYKTLKQIRAGNTKSRIEVFESM